MFARTACLRLKYGVEAKYQIRKQSLYQRSVKFFLKENLLLTNSLTSGGCMAIGDLVQQEIEYRWKYLPHRYDWGRIGRMFIVGTLLGPLHHYYYIYLDKWIPKVNVENVMFKIACDQAIAGPVTLVAFYYGMGLLEQKSLQECTTELNNKFLKTFLGDCIYWPPIQFCNFYYVPTHYRVVYINVATMIFNVFLSFMKHYD